MNKTLVAAATAIILAAPVAVLAADGMPGMKHEMGDMHHDMTASLMSEGVVKKVGKAAGKITLAHGPLQNLGMPGMTMTFNVKDAAWLDKLKANDKIRFVAEDINGALTVTRYEAVK